MKPFDLLVVGGGLGGLASAALAQAEGLRTALLESHTRLGGCAGTFSRGPFTFDAGATALMGLEPDAPLGAFLDRVGLDFQGERTRAYRVFLPDRQFDIVADPTAFEAACLAAFPGREAAKRRFWRLQAFAGHQLLQASGRIPRLPARGGADWAHNLRVLGLRGILAASFWTLTVADVLQVFGLSEDVPFRTLIAMLLQDTAQAGPQLVPFAQASACLQAYRLGMSRPKGGMSALSEGIGQRFEALGGTLRTASIVDRVEPCARGFRVLTRRRETWLARQVIFNLPLDRAAALLGRPLAGFLERAECRSRAAWSAFTGYLAIRREAIPDDAPLFHQVLQDMSRPPDEGNNVLVSLSPVGDEGYAPAEARLATLSTHTRPADWERLDASVYLQRKDEYARRLRAALARALPDAPKHLIQAEFASPRSFARYTRRRAGAVGGPPVSRRNSGFFAVGSDVLGPGLWLVGDSVFPGQGTLAVVLSAIRVIERITGRSWDVIRHSRQSRTDASRAAEEAPAAIW